MTTIRPLSMTDIPVIQKLASDPELGETANLPSPYPADGASQWFSSTMKNIADGRIAVFAITDEEKLVGVISIIGIDRSKKSASLGYWVGRPYWGQGYATDASKLTVAYAREKLKLVKMTSATLKRNIASRRVLEKCGFLQISEGIYDGPFKERFGHEETAQYSIEF